MMEGDLLKIKHLGDLENGESVPGAGSGGGRLPVHST